MPGGVSGGAGKPAQVGEDPPHPDDPAGQHQQAAAEHGGDPQDRGRRQRGAHPAADQRQMIWSVGRTPVCDVGPGAQHAAVANQPCHIVVEESDFVVAYAVGNSAKVG